MAGPVAQEEPDGSQYVEQSGDEDVLWEVEGIIAEKGKKYQVKWVGDDPKTGKPWGTSWVFKSDVTPDVVELWKEKQAKKAKAKALSANSKGKRKKSTPSTISNKTATTATATVRRNRKASASTTSRRRSAASESLSASPPPQTSISPSPRKKNGKRKLSVASDDSSAPDLDAILSPSRGPEPHKKKRRLSQESGGEQPKASTSKAKLGRYEESDETSPEPEDERPKAKRYEEEESDDAPLRVSAKVAKDSRSSSSSKTKTSNRKGKPRESGRSKFKSSVFVVTDDEEDASREEANDHPPAETGATVSGLTAKPRPKSGKPANRPTSPASSSATKSTSSTNPAKKKLERNAAGSKPKPVSGRPPSFPDPVFENLTPQTKKRLNEFDEELRAIALEEEAAGLRDTTPQTIIPYAESDVDSVAANVMYPNDEASPGRPSSPPPKKSGPVRLTPSRNTLKAKMKPRTPRSEPSVQPAELEAPVPAKSNGARLKPIPQLSPSKFRPHLPPSSSNQMDSTIEEDNGSNEEQEPSSSIEQFESPEKQGKLRVVPPLPARLKGKERAVGDFWSSPGLDVDTVSERGQEIYEKFKEKERRDWEPAPRKRTLEEITQRPRASSRSSSTPVPPRGHVASVSPGADVDAEAESVPEDDFEDLYVDEPETNQDTQMETEGDERPVERQFFPEEEEETTQDLLHELEVRKAISEGVPSRSPSPVAYAAGEDAQAEPVDVSMEPQPGTQPAQLPSPTPSQEQVEGTQEVPATVSARPDEDSQETNLTNSTTDSIEQKKHIYHMDLLHTKSLEIVELSQQLREEREKREQLDALVADLQDQLRVITISKEQNPRESELEGKYEETTKELGEVNARFEAAREAWSREKEVLLKQVEELKAKHDTVHSLFMEQYARVTQMSAEKKQLVQDAEIARSQATVGVAAIKKMYEDRWKSVDAHAHDWRKQVDFMRKMDARMNDSVRRLAAEHPELEAKLEQTKKKLGGERLMVKQLQTRLLQRRAEVNEYRLQLGLEPEEEEAGSSQSSVPTSQPSTPRSAQAMSDDDNGGGDDDDEDDDDGFSEDDVGEDVPYDDGEEAGGTSIEEGLGDSPGVSMANDDDDDDEGVNGREEMVYTCEWGSNPRCDSYFASKKELARHMVDAGHIQDMPGVLEDLD